MSGVRCAESPGSWREADHARSRGMRGLTIVLVGAHGAGKTTLGRALASRLGLPFDDELGRRLREEALAIDPGAHALIAQPEFDTRVITSELARDHARTGQGRVVESWHPINLSYASRRSPAVAAAFARRARAAARGGLVLVVPLRIDRATALERLSEPGPSPNELVEAFLDVAARAEAWARAAGIQVTPAIDTGRLTPTEALERALRLVGHCGQERVGRPRWSRAR